MRQLKSCGVLVVRGDPLDSYLLMQHTDRLDLPKGHVDPGESEVQCALRELWEETGITEQDIALDPDFRFTTQYPVRPERFDSELCQKTTVIFLGVLKREVEIVTTEHQGYAWYPWNPPQHVQANTIDPLLSALEEFLRRRNHQE